jgi:hypothetical protein
MLCALIGFSLKRQHQQEIRTTFRSILDPYASAVCLDDGAANRQSESRPLDGSLRVTAIEFGEYLLL